MSGLLVFVVGGSGVGKDTLLQGGMQALSNDPRFYFPKRIITREAVADLEDHDTISFDEYARVVASGGAALNWQAHGLGYLIPKDFEDHLAYGKTVVCNVSRTIIKQAALQYPVHVMNVVADIDLRSQRLSSRGRETAQEIKKRLARNPISLPDGVPITQVENNASLEVGVAAFVEALANLSVQQS